jgi:tRNA (cmo5U34)-methyltransferase
MPILRKVYEGLNDGGAFILAEKVYLNDGKTQDIFTFSYYDFKRKSFSPEEILGKQTALRKIMKNNTADELEEMLKKVGFKRVQPFFQALNFVGWLCIK